MFQRPQELDCVIGDYLSGKETGDLKPSPVGDTEITRIKKVLAEII